ncbi:dipeptide epimerase [Bacillus sp. FJAT-47783]|uniref:mandelate racemase/muconate lactonizing enzyme family protein n=1 Tax=Bacillus sp. FJAT-47783 TaxID=2922712 RepID=UPI001FAC4A58|nr:dipeptide epimerase [Bacillus sp. FJAT-47783]
MKIKSIELFGIRLPFITPFIVSYHTYNDMPSIIVKIETDDGLIGYGEGTPDEHVTGEEWKSTYEMIKNILAPELIGENPFNIEKIHEKMNKKIYGAPTAKAAIDIACYDLMGKAANQPVYNLLGGKYRDSLKIAKVISILESNEMASIAKEAIANGYKELKLKVGTDKQKDVERIRAVREAVGSGIPIRVDANQGWMYSSDALYVLQRVKDCDIDWIEQPVLADDMDALLEVKEKTLIPVMIDEGLHGNKEMREVISKRAADKINIKLMKCGGLFPATKLVHQAEMAGLTCQIGSMVESSVASSAGLHLATAKKNILSNELTGPLMFSKDIGNLTYEPPHITIPDTPGLGIVINEAMLQELTKMSAKIV